MDYYKVLGMDADGEIYGIECDAGGRILADATSCAVIRPVNKDALDDLRNDEETMLDGWQCEVAAGNTRLGLKEFFEAAMADCYDDEDYPCKDSSWVDDIIGDGEMQVKREVADKDAEEQTDEEVGTWESSGWFPPKERFAVEYAPKDILEEYYKRIGI